MCLLQILQFQLEALALRYRESAYLYNLPSSSFPASSDRNVAVQSSSVNSLGLLQILHIPPCLLILRFCGGLPGQSNGPSSLTE